MVPIQKNRLITTIFCTNRNSYSGLMDAFGSLTVRCQTAFYGISVLLKTSCRIAFDKNAGSYVKDDFPF